MAYKTVVIGDVFVVWWQEKMTLAEMQAVIKEAKELFAKRKQQQFIGLSIVNKGTQLPDSELRKHMDASQADMSMMQRSTHIVFTGQDAGALGKFALGIVNLVLKSKGQLHTHTTVLEGLNKAKDVGPYSPSPVEVLQALKARGIPVT